MVAGHQWESLIGREVTKEWNKLLRVGQLAPFEIVIKTVEQLRRIEWLVRSSYGQVENENELICSSPVLVRQRFRVGVLRPVELRDAPSRALGHLQLHCSEMRKLLCRLVIRR